MNELMRLLESWSPEDGEELREIIAYCETRVTSDEGIPAIIALDDLTNRNDSYYTPAAADAQMNMILAGGAMRFTDLYEQQSPDKNYPSIAFAMSAVAEKYFCAQHAPDGSFTVRPYRDVVGEFVKKHEK